MSYLKSLVKTWILNNMFEMSTYIGLFFFIRELMLYNSSIIVLALSFTLIALPDSKLRAFMLKHADGFKKIVEKW